MTSIEQLQRIDPAELRAVLMSMPVHEQEALLTEFERAEDQENIENCRQHPYAFAQRMWEIGDFIGGWHIRKMHEAFERVASGDLKRLIINMPPRFSKSESASVYFPAWYMGKFPDRKIVEVGHSEDLSFGFGRRVRNMVRDDEYQKIFPGVKLAADSKAAGQWKTNFGGSYYALGIRSKFAGKGADLLIIDDPHSETEGLSNDPGIFDQTYNWFSFAEQRLQPGGAIVIVMTRWSKRDLTARVLKEAQFQKNAEQWEVIRFPAIREGQSLWPEYWSLAELEKKKAGQPAHYWLSQYQQEPVAEGGNLIQKNWWRIWDRTDSSGNIKLPEIKFLMLSVDTAYSDGDRNNYNACTTWGVFDYQDPAVPFSKPRPNIMLMDAWEERLAFPELKAKLKNQYVTQKPDSFLIETKANGAAIAAEFVNMGFPVRKYNPTVRDGDKSRRMAAVSDCWSSGMVWALPTRNCEYAINQVADFPSGERDDIPDTVSMAVHEFRKGGLISLPSDDDWTEGPKRKPWRVKYFS